MICFLTVFQNFILFATAIPGPFSFHLNQNLKAIWIYCFTVTAVNFINDIIFIFCSYSVYKKVYAKCFQLKSGSFFVRSVRTSLLFTSTYNKFIFILISSCWISVACICCCDWDKLQLLVILWKILLLTLSWYPFSFKTCFILAFPLVKLPFWW